MKKFTKKLNFEVKIKLKAFERMTSEDVEQIILNLIKDSFEEGRVEAK